MRTMPRGEPCADVRPLDKFDRKGDTEDGADPGRAVHLDFARECSDQVLDDGQPEADATGTAVRAAVDLKEGNEDLVEVVLSDTRAGVAHLDV